jgi:isoleucyl-tRNA synthetase
LFAQLQLTKALLKVTVSFPLVDDPSTSLLAWTTTPWTLPSNLGLCVHPGFTYIKIHDFERNQNFILLENLLGTVYKGYDANKKPDAKKKDKEEKPKFKKVGTFVGKDMVGWRFTPIFDYFTEQVCTSPKRRMNAKSPCLVRRPSFPCHGRYLRHGHLWNRYRSASTGFRRGRP